jgi:pre-rRNA-processing protein TSR4
MWSGNDDCNEHGETVRLYHPIPSYHHGRTLNVQDPTTCYVGGPVSTTHECAICQGPLQSLVQVHVPRSPYAVNTVDRTLQVYACNRASCYTRLFDGTQRLCLGGGGVVKSRLQTVTADVKGAMTSDATLDSPTIGWNVDDAVDATTPTSDDWGVGNDAEQDMKDLEAKLASMESKEKTVASSNVASVMPSVKHDAVKQQTTGILPLELHSLSEPPSRGREGLDEDDVGLSMATAGNDSSDDKIQKMLAKYMAEEDDEDILSALRGGNANTQGGGRRGERDERLSAADRALLTFTDRLKRSPRQVIRYAYGGEPLWSM